MYKMYLLPGIFPEGRMFAHLSLSTNEIMIYDLSKELNEDRVRFSFITLLY